jgi:hypothetical protein
MKTKRLLMCFLTIAITVASVSASAANSWTTSLITDILVQDDGTANATGLVQVTMPTNMTYVPSCQTGALNMFYVDLSRAASKSQLSMLLAASAQGKSVTIALNESCIGGIALLRNVDFAP